MTHETPLRRLPDVLLVEDDDADAELLQLAITQTGKQVGITRMRNAEDAHRFLRIKAQARDIPPPDLVVIDGMLPGMSGSELLDFVKEDEYLSRTPAIFYCGAEPEELFGKVVRKADRIFRKSGTWQGWMDLAHAAIEMIGKREER